MNIYFRILFESDDFQNESAGYDRNARKSLLGAQYNEAIAVEDYNAAENIMESLKNLG
jgi:hypothetical protein